MASIHDSPITYRSSDQRGLRSRVALLEDTAAEADAVIGLLGGNGHDVVHMTTGGALLEALRRESFDVLILDWNLPDISGYEVLRRVRVDLHYNVPVLMLTARGSEFDVVQALNGGASDYLSKPWRPFELLARIQVMLRGTLPANAGETKEEEIDGWRFNGVHRTVTDGKTVAKMTHKEFELARLFFRHLGRPLSRRQIVDAVWGGEASLRTLDTHVSRVRTGMALTIENGYSLSSVYGFGYRLDRAAPSS